MMFHALAASTLLALASPTGGVGLSVVPGKVDTIVRPGTTSTIGVVVRNDHDTPVHVQITPADFRLTDRGDYVYESPGTHRTSLARWLSTTPREFDIPAESLQQVVVTIETPSARLSGEYGGVLLVQTRPTRQRAAIAYSARYALKIYGVVDGTIRHGAEVTSLHTVATSEGERYRVSFRNTGNAHVYANGRLVVMRGTEVIASYALPSSQLVERESERTFEVLGAALPHGTYDVLAVFDIGATEKIGGRVKFDA